MYAFDSKLSTYWMDRVEEDAKQIVSEVEPYPV